MQGLSQGNSDIGPDLSSFSASSLEKEWDRKSDQSARPWAIGR